MSQAINDQLVLIGGKSAGGKSASLRNLRNPERVLYLNCESGKRLPFPAKFKQFTISDPYQVHEAFAAVSPGGTQHDNFDVVVVDTLTYLLDMYESLYVINSANTQKAWGDFAQFFKHLMQQLVAGCGKQVIFLAHTLENLNESEMNMETKVPVKGSLKNNGIESYFSIVIAAKKVPTKLLANYASELLHITEEEELLGFKHVFQTKLTKETVGERLRSPLGLFTTQETFTDNDVQLILDRLTHYYA